DRRLRDGTRHRRLVATGPGDPGVGDSGGGESFLGRSETSSESREGRGGGGSRSVPRGGGVMLEQLLDASLWASVTRALIPDQIGGFAMERATDVSWQLAQVIQALVIVAVVSRFSVGRKRLRNLEKEEAVAEAEASHVGEV